MMGTALRILALFTIYSGIAFAGDYAAGLFAEGPREVETVVERETDVEVRVERAVEVQVRPEILSRIESHLSDRCDVSRDLERTVSADGVSRLTVHAGSGELRIEGHDDLTEIVAVGRACASEEEYLDDLTMSVEARGDDVTLETHYPDRSGWGSGRASIDLVVMVPTGLAVDVDDSSGGMEVEGTGALRIDDSSGSIRVADIRGAVSIDDSSGGIEVRGVEGDLTLEDGSGGIELRAVAGTVRVRDGSGSIEVVEAGADVIVESDGSGSIGVRDVAGSFRVERDGSGGIRHSDVRGSVVIPRDER
jgi:hypothetical protein